MTVRPAVDLRLAVPAATAWLAAAAACGWPVLRSEIGVVGALVALLLAALGRRLVLAAAATGLALGGSAAAAHVAALHSGPVALAARSGHTQTDVVLTLVRDPVARSGHGGRAFVLVDATVDVLGTTPAHAPVLVIAHGAGWETLLPGQRVRTLVRVSPPRAADDVAAVLLATGPPSPIGKSAWWQRAAGDVRGRLRVACSSLPPDERGLVPGLVVGDVSAMPTSLTDAFRVSGLTHLIPSKRHENSGRHLCADLV